jgi:hypothetical protein
MKERIASLKKPSPPEGAERNRASQWAVNLAFL